MKAFSIMWSALKAAYEELFLCVFMSIAWWIGTILVIPAAPVTMGMHRVANRIANYKRVDNSFFWEAARSRSDFGRGWLLYLLHIMMPIAVIFNVWFYANSGATWMRIIGIAWVWILLLILLFLQYLFPLFWQQDEPNIRLSLRNAFLLALRYPLYSILILVFQVVLLAVSFVIMLPLILLTPAVMAITANVALVGILQDMDLAPEPPVVPK